MEPVTRRVYQITEELADGTVRVIDTVQQVVDTTESTLEHSVAPVRKGLSTRFPLLYLLLVTVGVTATFLGVEQILLQSVLLQRYPMIILGLGLLVLAFTGTLYKKLR
jgi:hypothetical protein